MATRLGFLSSGVCLVRLRKRSRNLPRVLVSAISTSVQIHSSSNTVRSSMKGYLAKMPTPQMRTGRMRVSKGGQGWTVAFEFMWMQDMAAQALLSFIHGWGI